MDRVRVLHFELSSAIGGIESFLYNVYTHIDRERIQFDFVTTADKPALGLQLQALGCEIYKVAPHRDIASYSADIHRILAEKYDVIHVHKNSALNIVPIILASRANPKPYIITHAHNTFFSIGNKARILSWLHNISRKRLWELSDCHLACSEAAAKWMYGKRASSATILCHGVDVEKFRYDFFEAKLKRTQLGISQETFVVGHVGRFSNQKNHQFLIRIFFELKQKRPNSKLLLIGDGENRERIMAQVAELQLKDDVLFLGERDDVRGLLAAMDAFIFPSLYEGRPLAVVEAQAAGLEVYISDSVTRETELTSGVHWFSLTERPEIIAARILENYTGDIQLEKRNEYNRTVRMSPFNIERTVDILQNCYLSACSGKY